MREYENSVKITHGDFVEATIDGTTLVVKAKIEPSFSNKATIDQNYYNVCDIIRDQNGGVFHEIQYWAVADMTSGEESKVISFTVPKDMIDLIASQDFADKYNEAYLLTHAGINYNNQYNQTVVEGSDGRLILCPLANKADSKFIHVSPKINMLVGYDQMGDMENVMVKEYEPFILSYIATMFFGVQFESVDKRRLKVIEIGGSSAPVQGGGNAGQGGEGGNG